MWLMFLTPETAILFRQVLIWMVIVIPVFVTVIAIFVPIIHKKRNEKFRDEFFGNKDKEGK